MEHCNVALVILLNVVTFGCFYGYYVQQHDGMSSKMVS